MPLPYTLTRQIVTRRYLALPCVVSVGSMPENRTIFLTNFLNRNITDDFRPYFEFIYVLEVRTEIINLYQIYLPQAFFLIIFPFICIPIMHAGWKTTSYHRNVWLFDSTSQCQLSICLDSTSNSDQLFSCSSLHFYTICCSLSSIFLFWR